MVDSLGNMSCNSGPVSLTGSITSTPGTPQNMESLPEGWEERRTPSGRTYFVNHVSKTTHWERPTRPANEINANGAMTPNGEYMFKCITERSPIFRSLLCSDNGKSNRILFLP